jgi:hypothetical protein
MLVTQLIFAAFDTPSLQTNLLQDANQVASDLHLSPVVTAAVAAALQQDAARNARLWL